MAQSALSQLQQQIEAIRREAFAEGYATAMRLIRAAAAQPAPHDDAAGPPPVRRPGRIGRPPGRSSERSPERSPGRPSARMPAPRTRPRRGTNARMIAEILQGIAPRAARPAEIRTVLQRDKGVAMAFTSIRHALGQLQAQKLVEPLADGKTWRRVS